MSSKIDFLSQSIRQIKKSIKDIDDSYNNDWDILAELCQNSVDAIRRSGSKKGNIKLLIDSQNRSITIYDNGCGISAKDLPQLLAPFSTDKEEDADSVGEKGVGLTFVIFTSNRFYIESSDGKTCSEGTILDAFNWKNSSNTSDLIELNHKILEDTYKGTTITIKEVNTDRIFQLSFNQLVYLLRTRTAIGNTNTLWEKDINIKVELEHINQDGEAQKKEIPFKYCLPTEGQSSSATTSIKDFQNFIKTDKTDAQKRNRLIGKIIEDKGMFDHSGRTIKYWACFVPQRKTWDTISIQNGLCTEENLEDLDWVELHNYTLFHSGIHTSVKGMPTGVYLNNPITGAQSYWAQVFILFDDKQIKFDIGRKALPGRQSEIYKKKGKEIFNEYAKLFKYVGRRELEVSAVYEKNEIFAQIEEELDLNNPISKFLKNPGKQEASVAGLFFECIGNGIITELSPMMSGYKSKYDLYAKWGARQIVIEFKSKLLNVINDFNEEQKMFDELDCLVCWNVDEEDERAFRSKSIELEELESSELAQPQVHFPNATHILRLSYVEPIYVIDMKRIMENSTT